jgi:hypothetical protein
MEQVIANLQRAIDAASSLAAELQSRPSQRDIDDFFSLCQRFIDLRTKCLLAKRIEDSDFPSSLSDGHVDSSNARYEALKEEVRSVEQSLQSIAPDRLQQLITEARQVLADVTARLDHSQAGNLDDLARMTNEELSHLEDVTRTHAWYEDAYHRLSDFTGVAIEADNSVRLLGTHKIQFSEHGVALDPPTVFVGDLDPSESSTAICISEVIERIAALNDMESAARQLAWEIEVDHGAPIVSLFPPETGIPAVFALVGYLEHPLVEWGSIDVDEFNGMAQPLLEKLRRFARSVRAF